MLCCKCVCREKEGGRKGQLLKIKCVLQRGTVRHRNSDRDKGGDSAEGRLMEELHRALHHPKSFSKPDRVLV